MPNPAKDDLSRLQQSVRELSVLNEIAATINVSMSLEDITRTILEHCIRHTGASQGAVFLLKERGQGAADFHTFVREVEDAADALRFHLDESIKGWMIRHRSMFRSNAVADDERLTGVNFAGSGVTSILAAPLVTHGELIGVLTLFNAAGDEGFQQHDERFLGIVGTQTAHVIENARLLELETEFLNRLQAEKMASLAMVIAGVAHEINSPLGALTSSEDMIRRSLDRLKETTRQNCPDGCWTRQDFQAALNALESSGQIFRMGSERISNIVSRLKAFVNLDEAGLQRIDIKDGLESCLELLEPQLGGKVQLTKDYQDIRPFACFPAELKQVFFNVLLNAAQAIDAEGEILVSTRQDEDAVRITIRDTGRGITSSRLDRIFDPDFSSTGGRIKAAFGLPICFQIVKRHRGKITLQSKEGEGTAVTITLPTNLMDLLELKT